MSTLQFPQLVLFDHDANAAPTVQADALSGAPHVHAGLGARRRATLTGLRVCVLGSGSGGNSTVLAHGQHGLLIDLGFGPSTTRRRLGQAGLALEHVRAACLTHLDQDHFRKSWPATLLKHGIRLFVHHWHLPELHAIRGAGALFEAGLVDTFDGEPFEPLPCVTARGVRLQHDMQGTIGYRFDVDDACLGRFYGSVAYATDLGHAPNALIDLFAGADLVCLESNYDEHMTIHSPRPAFVNRRNMSDSGHLSNEQAFEAVCRIAEASPHGNPRHVLLMHRSQLCNHPTKVRRVFERHPVLCAKVTLTEQRRRTRWFHVKPLRAAKRCQHVLGF